MAQDKLKKVSKSKVQVLKLKNRKGYAAICMNNLTEGATAAQALARLKNPLRRMGLTL